jgi:quercetin dioxygenase-like cupin family protein
MATYKFGHQVGHVQLTGQESGGEIGIVVVETPGGPGAPLHVHRREDETFYVLEGEITLLVGDEIVHAAAGDVAFAPRNVPHTYTIDSASARVLVVSTPAGFEEFVAAVGSSDEDVSPEMLARIAAQFGIEILGPPMTREDLLAAAA